MCNKQELRQEMKRKKLAIPPTLRMIWSQQICQTVEALPEFTEAHHILLYHALPDEVCTAEMLNRWSVNKQLYLPIVEGEELIIKPYTPEHLQQGAFGIWEPTEAEAIDPTILDWIIVPGVAFDKQLNRLGRGKGYYDRLLAHSTARKIAIAYELQVCDNIPTEPHDITMDILVTEKQTIYTSR